MSKCNVSKEFKRFTQTLKSSLIPYLVTTESSSLRNLDIRRNITHHDLNHQKSNILCPLESIYQLSRKTSIPVGVTVTQCLSALNTIKSYLKENDQICDVAVQTELFKLINLIK